MKAISGKMLCKIVERNGFESLGWEAVRQARRHIIMTKDQELVTLSVPDHREVVHKSK